MWVRMYGFIKPLMSGLYLLAEDTEAYDGTRTLTLCGSPKGLFNTEIKIDAVSYRKGNSICPELFSKAKKDIRQLNHSFYKLLLNSRLYYEDSEILFELTLASVIFIQFIKECY